MKERDPETKKLPFYSSKTMPIYWSVSFFMSYYFTFFMAFRLDSNWRWCKGYFWLGPWTLFLFRSVSIDGNQLLVWYSEKAPPKKGWNHKNGGIYYWFSFFCFISISIALLFIHLDTTLAIFTGIIMTNSFICNATQKKKQCFCNK